MPYLFISYLFMVFLFMVPFGMGINTFFSLKTKQAGSNFKLVFYTIDISIKSKKDGLEIDGIKGKEYRSVNSNKKRMDLFLNPGILEKINIDRVRFVFMYGKSDDAYQTCLMCNVMNVMSALFNTIFKDRIKDFRKIIVPQINKDSLFIQLRIDLKVNLFIIFSTLFKIIILKLRKRFGIGGD